MRQFERELGLENGRLTNYLKYVPKRGRFNNKPCWSAATPSEITAAISSNSLVIKDYGQPVALQPVFAPAQPSLASA